MGSMNSNVKTGSVITRCSKKICVKLIVEIEGYSIFVNSKLQGMSESFWTVQQGGMTIR